MICHHCNTQNADDHDFCVSCGQPINATVQRPANIYQPPGGAGNAPPRSSVLPWVLAGGGLLLILVIGGGFFAASQLMSREVLPTHFGMFVQNDAKDRVDEIRRQDFANAIEGKAALLKDDTLPAIISQPNLVLNADSSVNVNDLRLVQLDTIKDDGSMQQIDLQVAPVEGKPEMKRLRVPDGLANGKYALAIFDSYINEGKQRFWPFQVRDSAKSDNGSALRAASVPLKPKAPAAPTPTAPTTAGPITPPPAQPAIPPPMPTTGMRTIAANYVRVRVGPSSKASFHPTFRFNRGARVNVVGYSGYECPKSGKGCGPWAEIEGGYYVHSSLLR
ncbi:MAG: zinc ribbon domain-containing protein [Pyrinomonadaceae bacterium]|nr:zinc ribbon domain-containing protein [Pyrinomonadaceae bacterium]